MQFFFPSEGGLLAESDTWASGANYNGFELIMENRTDEPIKLTRDSQVVAVPAGHTLMLPQGTEVMITQSLGGSYTLLVPSYGGLFRLANRDADAIGIQATPAEPPGAPGQALSGEALEKEVWQALKTCFDPEIPVNIVDLGLIYGMDITQLPDGSRVDVKMTLTAQGCGMGASIAADARNKILDLPGVVEADVQVVWDPVWTPEKISPEGRALLGIQ
jgi:probable FeS assembly SUF system protein SufT